MKNNYTDLKNYLKVLEVEYTHQLEKYEELDKQKKIIGYKKEIKDFETKLKDLNLLKEKLEELNILGNSKTNETETQNIYQLKSIINQIKETKIEQKDLTGLINISEKEIYNYKQQQNKQYQELEKEIQKIVDKYNQYKSNAVLISINNPHKGKVSDILNRYSSYIIKDNKSFNQSLHNFEIYLKENNFEKTYETEQIDIENIFSSENNKLNIIKEYEELILKEKIENKHLKYNKEEIQQIINCKKILKLLEEALKTNANLENTNQKIKELKEKYENELQKYLTKFEKSDYAEIEKIVKEERLKTDKLDKDNAKIEKASLLFKKLTILNELDPNNIKEIEETERELREIPLDDRDRKNAELKAVEEAHHEMYNKKIEQQIAKEELQKKEEIHRQSEISLRNAAISELELEGKFKPEYEEKNGDIRNSLTDDQKEKLIRTKIEELREKSKLSYNDRALYDCQKEGIIPKEATLETLTPLQKNALEATKRMYNETYKLLDQYISEQEKEYNLEHQSNYHR